MKNNSQTLKIKLFKTEKEKVDETSSINIQSNLIQQNFMEDEK